MTEMRLRAYSFRPVVAPTVQRRGLFQDVQPQPLFRSVRQSAPVQSTPFPVSQVLPARPPMPLKERSTANAFRITESTAIGVFRSAAPVEPEASRLAAATHRLLWSASPALLAQSRCAVKIP